MNVARMPETHGPAQNGRASKVHLASLEHDGLVERQVPELLVFGEEDAQENGITWDLHGHVR
jgi:hypothetical protein